jgi:hypothetical protein
MTAFLHIILNTLFMAQSTNGMQLELLIVPFNKLLANNKKLGIKKAT